MTNELLRIGIVGLGYMGMLHARMIEEGKIPRLQLTAVCDSSAERRGMFPKVNVFSTLEELLAAKAVDAVLVATPHPSHVGLGIQVLNAGLHLLMEKPLGTHVAEVRKLIEAAGKSSKFFGIMLNQRSDPMYQRLRSLVVDGELGEIKRVCWTITDWFRPVAYYRAGSWRATWSGEGGGVLLNQCSHQLDLWQWIFGMPQSILAQAGFGRHHAIEVEDEVTAFLEYPNGTTGVFIASTGEMPGVNRLEIATDRGLVTLEGRSLRWKKIAGSIAAFNQSNLDPMGQPAVEEIIEEYPDKGGQHETILANFTDCILDGAKLLAPGCEGIASLELANAMIMSALEKRAVLLPLDADKYARHLAGLIEKSQAR